MKMKKFDRKVIVNLIFLLLFMVCTCANAMDKIAKGEAEEKKGNFGNAVKLFESALEEDPNNAYLYYKLGSLYLEFAIINFRSNAELYCHISIREIINKINKLYN